MPEGEVLVEEVAEGEAGNERRACQDCEDNGAVQVHLRGSQEDIVKQVEGDDAKHISSTHHDQVKGTLFSLVYIEIPWCSFGFEVQVSEVAAQSDDHVADGDGEVDGKSQRGVVVLRQQVVHHEVVAAVQQGGADDQNDVVAGEKFLLERLQVQEGRGRLGDLLLLEKRRLGVREILIHL